MLHNIFPKNIPAKNWTISPVSQQTFAGMRKTFNTVVIPVTASLQSDFSTCQPKQLQVNIISVSKCKEYIFKLHHNLTWA